MVIDIFSENDLERYSRNFLISNWGTQTQLKLKNSRVIFAELDEVCCRYLLAAGVISFGYYSSPPNLTEELKKFSVEAEILKHDSSRLTTPATINTIFIHNSQLPLNQDVFEAECGHIFQKGSKLTLEILGETINTLELGGKYDLSKPSIGIHQALLAIKYFLAPS